MAPDNWTCGYICLGKDSRLLCQGGDRHAAGRAPAARDDKEEEIATPPKYGDTPPGERQRLAMTRIWFNPKIALQKLLTGMVWVGIIKVCLPLQSNAGAEFCPYKTGIHPQLPRISAADRGVYGEVKIGEIDEVRDR